MGSGVQTGLPFAGGNGRCCREGPPLRSSGVERSNGNDETHQGNLRPMSDILALINARGGSKSIPRKNIALLAGKPMIAWTIEAALLSPSLSRVVVSTDDAKIAEIARGFGAEVPFLRPAELARDDTPA